MNAATGQEKTRSPREAPGAPGALLRLEGQPPAVADPATITRAGRTSSVTSFCVDKRAAHLARGSMRGTSFGTMDRLRPGSGGVLRPLTNCSAVPFSCISYRDNGLGALRAWSEPPPNRDVGDHLWCFERARYEAQRSSCALTTSARN